MLTPDGTPLKRRYFCSGDGKALTAKEIVRGFEQPDGSFVVISDDELEALAPRKSRDIDLRLFVEREAIPVRLLQRSYVLAPSGDSSKAYHLLALTMEQLNLAGIATFVMRDKEYLVAIVAGEGLLRASTLHFIDEIRTPESIGLPDIRKAPETAVKKAKTALKQLAASSLDEALLRDEGSAAILALAERKQKKKVDVVESEIEPEAPESEPGEIIDIMAVLRKRIAEGGKDADQPAIKKNTSTDDLEQQTRDALYEQAQTLDLPGRSAMSKSELIDALREAS